MKHEACEAIATKLTKLAKGRMIYEINLGHEECRLRSQLLSYWSMKICQLTHDATLSTRMKHEAEARS
jgi:hypothetical protein